jgi:GTP diphosphokinase / guanosine-3',5'-bis(diphosphate) 3'-diphosphatase
MSDWARVLAAADAAAKWHTHQRRKGPSQEPYLNHLLEVASLVAEATKGTDPDLVIAALLHDAIEDQEVPEEIIESKWGRTVVGLVLEVTDDKSLPKSVRKQKQIETSATKSSRAKLIKLADKTSNLRSIAVSAPAEWSVKRKLQYIAWSEQVGAVTRPINSWLESQFDSALEEARNSVALKTGV